MLICLVPSLMLAADLVLDGMSSGQYEFYPALFRALNAAAAACGLAYIAFLIRGKSLDPRMLRRPPQVFFAAFIVCVLISTCVNGLTTEAIHGVSFRNIGIFLTFQMIVIYMGVSSCISREALRQKILLLYIGAADLIGAAVIYDLFTNEIDAFHQKKEISAIFFNGNHYGYFLLMAALASLGLYLYSESRTILITGAVSAALNGGLLLLNKTTGCILAAALIACAALTAALLDKHAADKGTCSAAKRAGAALAVMLAAVIAALILAPELRYEFAKLLSDAAGVFSGNSTGSEGHNRWKLWQLTAGYISEKPLTGYGCEGIWVRMYTELQRSDPHNEILTYAAYYGIPAAVFYVLGVVSMLVMHLRSAGDRSSCERAAFLAAAAYFASSIFGVAMFYTAPFFFLFLGLQAGNPKQG